MFIEERHDKIMELLKEKKRIEVYELSSYFGVSVDTIRRDLRILEEKGLLQKTYGGAIPVEKSGKKYTLEERKNLYVEEKNSIAGFAANFIEESDTLFFESSTTVAALIPLISHIRNLTIFTTCIMIANRIIESGLDCTLYMVGGVVDKQSGSTHSPDTLEAIGKLHVDKVFSGFCSIHSEWGFSTPNLWEAPLMKAILEAGTQNFFLSDSTKFEKKASVKVCGFKENQIIITDRGLTKEIYNKYAEQGVTIHYAQ